MRMLLIKLYTCEHNVVIYHVPHNAKLYSTLYGFYYLLNNQNAFGPSSVP